MAIMCLFIALSLVLFFIGLLMNDIDESISVGLVVVFLGCFAISMMLMFEYIWDYNKAATINKNYGTSYTVNDFFYNNELTMKEINTRNHLVDKRNAIDVTVSQ